MGWSLLLLAWIFTYTISNGSAQNYKFPNNIKLGVASSAPQIEGGWDADGRGESFWDRLLHNDPSIVVDRSNMDVSSDSYHLYERDLEMLSELEVEVYRFSISWTRILPTGFAHKVNQPGIDYYNKIIDGLLARGITPLVTIYHWDLPQSLHELGGWANPQIVNYYVDYANVVFKAFGDRVKNWITINEPLEICIAYGGLGLAPRLNMSGIADYLCGHTILLAHARAYHLYDEVYRKQHEDSKIGIVLDQIWLEPETDSENDKAAALKEIEFGLGWFAHPIFTKKGNYPSILIETVARKSLEQGFPESRLPKLSAEEIEYIKGTSDFFGLNHYSTKYAHAPRSGVDYNYVVPSRTGDIDVQSYYHEDWPGSAANWLKVVPWGFRKILKYVKDNYNSPSVMITENGFPNYGGLEDDDRISYITSYLSALLDSINQDGVDVIVYTVWSLMDSFEWSYGLTNRFGLYEVDFDSPNKTRVMRKSAYVYRDIIRRRSL